MEAVRSLVLDDFRRFKKIAAAYAKNGKPEHALRTIYFACGFMFHMNQLLWDEELEQMLGHIVKKYVKQEMDFCADQRTCLFYDSFGRADRGLAGIYLKALGDLGYRTIYVTPQKNCAGQGQLLPYVRMENIRYVKNGTFLGQMGHLLELIKEAEPGICLLHLMPDDIVAAGAFLLCENVVKRYLVNLTDHAFWIGKNIADVVINFRQFGAKACAAYRGIPGKQNAYLPYYPDRPEVPFSGFGGLKQEKPVIFSGGHLYKTQSRDNKYYRMVARLLQKFDVNFVYFGNGDAKKIRTLCRKYPGRVLFCRERRDYFEAMKRSVCYLSTYPYNGGLMAQYALLARKVPVTLRAHGIEDELTIHPEDAFWNYDTVEDCMQAVERLLADGAYRKKQEQKLAAFLVSREQFTKELGYLLTHGSSIRKVENTKVTLRGFMEQPLWYYRGIRYSRLFFRRNGFFFLWHFPMRYLCGAAGRVLERIYHGK